ncbi:MAG TPA: HAMP domain-containing sensor histidine kinase, partial [Chryseosolibacter sp.]
KKHRMEQDLYAAKTAGAEKNFAVYFPHKGSYLISQLNIWIFSTLALLFMMCFFAYAIVTLLRERRFAQLKSDFINNMTHEFKTPVTNIGITGEIIRKKVPEMANVGVYLDILLKENEKLRHKIDEVLLGSSADYGLRPALQRLDIHQLISQCAEAFQLKVGERNGKIELAFHANSNFILGDRELLTQAINNVIDNAEKYSPREPHIRIATRDERNGIGIEIIDDGVGIPPKLTVKVFEKFFRVEHGGIHNVKGFGLGLSFVKSVIRSHRGRIRLSSELNKGTEVKIFLPAI